MRQVHLAYAYLRRNAENARTSDDPVFISQPFTDYASASTWSRGRNTKRFVAI